MKILHTADTHLGYRQYHSEVRRKDFFKAFELVVNDAIEMQVDAVVHAGDLFDSRNPTLEDLLETINILTGLKAASIPFFGIVGNHENKQNTQWLDLLEQMGFASRLGKKPKLLGNVAIYGVDSVPRSKIPLFDYSGFEAPEASESYRKLLVMHQIVQPFPYAEWNCEEILENFPFSIDAILLGDYHLYEKFKVKDAWVTYPGSTERNSVSEREARSYNIISLSDDGLEISKRTIPTRNFLFIPAKVDGEEKPYEQIFSAVNEHSEELPESVVFLELSGASGAVISFSEIEEYLLNKGTLVPKVVDKRKKEALSDELLKVTFTDPERAVSEEIKRMNLNEGSLIIDEIVRNPSILKSRVEEETESRLSKLIGVIDFKDPDFRIEDHTNLAKMEKSKPVSGPGYSEDFKPAMEAKLTTENEPRRSDITNSEESKPAFTNANKIDFPQENFEFPKANSENELKFSTDSLKEPVKKPENKIENFSEPEVKKETEFSNEYEVEEKKEFLNEKTFKSSNLTEKIPKKGQKKGKEKSAKPRQYNLGDYL